MLYVVIGLTVIIDQVTKFLAAAQGQVSLNQGISFGWLSVVPPVVLTVGLMSMLLGVWWITRADWAENPVAMGLFIGGAVSNLLDRVFFAGVQDWLPVPGTTIHNNLADYAIGIGLLMLVIVHCRNYWRGHANRPTEVAEVRVDQKGADAD